MTLWLVVWVGFSCPGGLLGRFVPAAAKPLVCEQRLEYKITSYREEAAYVHANRDYYFGARAGRTAPPVSGGGGVSPPEIVRFGGGPYAGYGQQLTNTIIVVGPRGTKVEVR